MQANGCEVVVAGHVCLDITPTFGRISEARLSEILRPGKLLKMEGVSINPGGTVGNTGPALHRLGVKVALMGKCGDDPFGHILLERLRDLAPGAEARMQVVAGERTSYSVVIAPPGVDRVFLHCPGANDTFGPEDVELGVVRGARLFHFGYPPLMKRMYDDGGREAGELLQGALQKLSPELRETVILRDLEELEYREIARVLNVPEGTVKSRLNRGRAELAKILRRQRVTI